MANIYVIDDDDQLLRMVGLMLERNGHTTTLINNPVDGLERIKEEKPDLLVLDVMMPDMSGHEVARRIRDDKAISDVPVLILTARSQDIDRATALQSGADDYLSKPVTTQELVDKVNNLIAQRSNPRQGSAGGGTVIVFYGMRGGVGKTTTAVNLAAALRRLSQQDVCLVDFSHASSQAIIHLRLQPRTSWADLPTDLQALNWTVVKESLLSHASGMRVLAAPVVPQDPSGMSEERARALLTLLRQNHLFTVVDLPNAYTPLFKATMKLADVGLHVLSPDVVGVQTAVQLNRFLLKEEVVVAQKSHLLNQISSEAQLPPAMVEKGLGSRVPFQIPHDPHQAAALAQGIPLALTSAKTPIGLITQRMAEVIMKRVASSK